MKPTLLLLVFSGIVMIMVSCRKTVNSPAPVLPIPSERQLAWHELEQYAFLHFTTNTFTGKEWGFGDEDPDIFNPSELNTDQWPNTIKMVQEMEPDIVFFSDAGPDIRWCGNEKGYVGETNWSLLSTDTIYAGKPRINALLNQGSENGKQWLPAEVDVSIRPGWFYHAKEDSLDKTPEQLFDIYLSSVGRGANLILNIPPDQRGLLHENDVKSNGSLGWNNLLKLKS